MTTGKSTGDPHVWHDLCGQALEALRVGGDVEPMTCFEVGSATGRPGDWEAIAEALHHLQRLGLVEVWRIPGDAAAYWRCTVTVVDAAPVDLDAYLAGAA